jgi:multidrug efflux pump subunit AcrA (membrane-fusion protein)
MYRIRVTSSQIAIYLLGQGWLALLIVVGCNTGTTAPPPQPVPKVTVTPVISQETIDSDEYTGRTEASESVEVRSRIFGYLKSIEFKDGDFVKEDQLLFTIEPDEYEAIHHQSLARIAVTETQYELNGPKHKADQKRCRVSGRLRRVRSRGQIRGSVNCRRKGGRQQDRCRPEIY